MVILELILYKSVTVVLTGELSSMRHLKDEVESIARGKECGLRFEDDELRFQPGDTLICYRIREVPQKTDWDPGF